MPKPVKSHLRLDGQIRIRLTYSMQAEVKALAKKKKVSIAELCRRLLQAEIDKSKEAI